MTAFLRFNFPRLLTKFLDLVLFLQNDIANSKIKSSMVKRLLPNCGRKIAVNVEKVQFLILDRFLNLVHFLQKLICQTGNYFETKDSWGIFSLMIFRIDIFHLEILDKIQEFGLKIFELLRVIFHKQSLCYSMNSLYF